MGWAEIIKAIGYYAVYPVTLVGPSVLELLRILAAPLFHVLFLLLQVCLIPIRVLRNLESLYVFFGVAAIVGVCAGCVLHFSLGFVYDVLGLEDSPPSDRQGRQAARLRDARLARAMEDNDDEEGEERVKYDDSEYDTDNQEEDEQLSAKKDGYMMQEP